jgi:uncharacterized protein
MTADEIIAKLGLLPHPEGGHFRETFRDERIVGADGRAASTAIYFLLGAGQVSRWHKIDAVEIWHFYAGDPLELAVQAPGQARSHDVLGRDLGAGQRPQIVVPAHAWQMARSHGAWSLVGCTVAPGFEFSGFVMPSSSDFNPEFDASQ